MNRSLIVLSCSLLAFTSCKEKKKEIEAQAEKIHQKEQMEEKKMEKKGEWVQLFNGENLEGWKAYNKAEISEQWQVEDGAIVFTPLEKIESSENLISKEEFESFELSLEWRISEGGNSGVMWAVQEDEQYSEPYLTGPEIQVLDNNKHPDAKNGLDRTAGALYDMVPPKKDVTKPAGEWNKEVIHIDYKNNEGWVELNGIRITEFPLYGKEWEKLLENSKFSDWEGFGKNKSGHIALQDHGDKVWYRNIQIKRL